MLIFLLVNYYIYSLTDRNAVFSFSDAKFSKKNWNAQWFSLNSKGKITTFWGEIPQKRKENP